MFFLSVLALNALNIPIKINKAKYAVIKYSYLVPTLTIDLTTFDLRKITHNNAEYKPVIKISLYIYLFIIGSFKDLGFYCIVSKSGGSKENANPEKVSIIIFIHNLWIIVIGVETPIKGPTIETNKAHKFTVSW